MDPILREALRRERELRHQLDNLLLGDEGDIWEAELRKFVAKRACWSTADIITAIESGNTELWLHEGQKTGWVQGHKIFKHLTDTGLLAGCADLDELKAIQAKGIKFFRKHFAEKVVFAWQGVQDDRVPYLIEYDDEVVLNWYRLDHSWRADYPALRRK